MFVLHDSAVNSESYETFPQVRYMHLLAKLMSLVIYIYMLYKIESKTVENIGTNLLVDSTIWQTGIRIKALNALIP